MLQILKNINSEIILSNPYWDYALDKYILPDKTIGEYHYVKSKGSTMIIPMLNDNNIILVRQYRYLNKMFSIEFPGGGIKLGKKPRENAVDELCEETGLKTNNIELIGKFNPFNGVTDEICYIYLAKELEKSTPNPDNSEEIEIINLNINDIINKIESGEIWDGMTLAAWSIFRIKQNTYL